MSKIFVLIGILLLTQVATATPDVPLYETTDNTGLNKKEQIETIDKYLVELVASLKKMDIRLDENSKKLKTLEEVVSTLKSDLLKKTEPPVDDKKIAKTKELSELDKIKADILILKNVDIEKIKINIEVLSNSVRMLEATK